MSGLVWKLNDLILDRRTIARSDAGDLSGIQGRLMKVGAYRFMNQFRGITKMAIQLLLPNLVSGERKGHWAFVRRLRLKRFPVNCSSIEPGRRAGFQSTHPQAEVLKRLCELNRSRLAGATA